MPFERLFPRSFAAGSIREHAPAMSGVYGISNAAEWIYIGEADNIQEALLQHLRDPNAVVGFRKPTGFVYEVCDRASRPARQDRLVLEYEPACNRNQARPR
jgi:hypothetical protein